MRSRTDAMPEAKAGAAANVDATVELLGGRSDQIAVFPELIFRHANSGRKAVRHRVVTGHQQSSQPTSLGDFGILRWLTVGVFAKRRV